MLYPSQRSNKLMGGLLCVLSLMLNGLNAQITLQPDRPTATYSIGELAQFQLTANQNGSATYELFYEADGPILESGAVNVVSGNTLNIPVSLNEAGVVFCEVSLNGNTAKAAISIAPFTIDALENESSDFDNFWQNAKNELAGIPMDAQVNFLQNNTYSTTYRLSVANINGRRTYGYVTIPNGNGPFPAVIKFPPFGSSANLAGIGAEMAEKAGVIYCSMTIHNAPPDQTDANAYQPNDLNDPNQIYFKQVVLGGIRTIDYLFTRNDFDGQHIGLIGESQGGGVSLMVAGVDNRVKAIMTSNPTHCQNLGFKYGKASGFGFFLNNNAPNSQQEAVKYYDNIYFARRYNGNSWSFIAYKDEVCHAATTFAAFNQLNGAKILTHSTDIGHVHPSQFWNDRFSYFRRLFPTAKPSNPFVGNDLGNFIDAGANQNIATNGTVNLSATIEYNNTTNPNYSVQWEMVSGPGVVNFSNSQTYATTANFSQEGTYILRFSGEDTELINSNPAQYFTFIDEITITVGQCTDEDNDGVCTTQDCDDNNENVPTTPGTACNDDNAETENDEIQADGCTCLGTPINTCTDNDTDGVCAAEDCDDANPNVPATPNSSCDDGNPTTQNDLIQADGCTCLGETPNTGNPNVCEVQITTGNGSIAVTGMDEPNFKLQVFNQYWSEKFYECFWNNCPANTTISNLENGTYVVKVQSFNANWNKVCDFIEYVVVNNDGGPCTDNDNDGICAAEDCDDNNENIPTAPGTSCNDGDNQTENDVILSDGCTCQGTPIMNCEDNDGDGICAAEDCDDNNENIPTVPGTNCNDGDNQTENDVILSDGCTCQGTPIMNCEDNDDDGVCAAEDCDDNNENIPTNPGTNCNDGNPNTGNDVIQADGCTCEGEPIDTSEPNCDNVQFDGSNNQLTISGLTAPIEIIRVRNANWQEVYKCVANCENPLTIPNLSAGLYRIQIQMYTQNWGQICIKETMATVSASSSSARTNHVLPTPSLQLFPNPAQETVGVNMQAFYGKKVQLRIVNQLGKQVFQKEFSKVSNEIEMIHLTSFTNGLYFVQLKVAGRKLVSEKLIVTRLY